MTSAERSLRSRRFLGWATAVLLLAALLRLVALHDVPPGLAQDEVLNADVATFIREGRHALFFREGYGHEPLYHYWSVPFQALLGDNVLSIRLPAVALGMLLIALTMRWARREFGELTAVIAGAGLAISWWPIVFSRVGLRPIMEPLLLVAAFWFWPRRPAWAGLFLGLSIYAYTAARYAFLIPLAFAGYLLLARREKAARPPGYTWRGTAVVFAVAFLLYLPLFFTLRADPSLQQRVDQLAGPLQALAAGDPGPALETTLATLGVFSFTGDPRWTYTLPGRPLFDPLTSIFFYAGFLLLLWRWRRPRNGLLLIWFAFALAPSALTPDAPSTVRLVGAMPLVYLMPALALSVVSGQWIVDSGWRSVISERLSVIGERLPIPVPRSPFPVYCLLFTVVLFLTIRDGFVRWPAAAETRLKYQTVLLQMARAWEAEPVSRWVVADGFFEPIDADSLRRNAAQPLPARWTQTGDVVAGAVVVPDGVGDGRFYVPEFAPPHSDLLAAAGIPQRPLYRSPTDPSFAIYALPPAVSPPAVPAQITLEEQITFLGHTMLQSEIDKPIRLLTYWRAEAPLPSDLAAFVHLLGEEGVPLSQHDGFDAAPSRLLPGDLVIQHHVIPPPPEADEAEYTLQTGLYRRSDDRRLTRPDPPVDRISLGTVISEQ